MFLAELVLQDKKGPIFFKMCSVVILQLKILKETVKIENTKQCSFSYEKVTSSM